MTTSMHRVLVPFFLIASTLFQSTTVHAQDESRVSGVVRTQSGQPLGGALVELTSRQLQTETDSGGCFVLRLPARTKATVVIRHIGYESVTLQIEALREGENRRLGVTLPSLAQLDVVTVIAERQRPLVNTRDAATGGSIDRVELERLPADSRDALALAYNIPGVAQNTGFFGDAPKLTVDGANGLYTQYSLDGLENNEGFLGGPRVEVPLSALSSLNVLATTYGTEFGRSSNGVVNMETRSGGVGYLSLFFLGTFTLFDSRVEAEARTLGATSWQTWWRVIVPLLRTQIAEALALGFLISWTQFALTLVVGGGAVRALPLEIFSLLRVGQDRAAAVGSLLLILPPVAALAGLRWAVRRTAVVPL